MTYNPDQPPSIRPLETIRADVERAKAEMAKSRAALKGLRKELDSYPHNRKEAGALRDAVEEALKQTQEEGD